MDDGGPATATTLWTVRFWRCDCIDDGQDRDTVTIHVSHLGEVIYRQVMRREQVPTRAGELRDLIEIATRR